MYATSRYLHELKLKGCTVKSNSQHCIIMLASVLTVPICLFSNNWGEYALNINWQTPDDRRAPSQTTEHGISP